MTHPHDEWDRAALERYVGNTEALTLEFKSHRSLLPTDKKSKANRILEAARDVAGMANEQGGLIIYGIEESSEAGFRTATGVGEGFAAGDKIDREWFVQVMRDHINPPLTELDVVHVKLDDTHVALVIKVPQSRGVARQTDDLFFPRRDAQGLHNMTVQEIEDVRGRLARPELELRMRAPAGRLKPDGSGFETPASFDIFNSSQATASFAAVTLALTPGTTLTSDALTAWRYLPGDTGWTMMRAIIASGSTLNWSPITPGFNVSLESAFFHVRKLSRPEGGWRTVALARCDHDGGSRRYYIEFGPHVGLGLRLIEFPGNLDWDESQLPEMFKLVSPTSGAHDG